MSMIRAEIASWETRWGTVLLYLGILSVIALLISRYWFAPTVSFDKEGVHIKPFRAPAFFVPYQDVTRLQGVRNIVDDIFNRRHKLFDLYYLDAYGAPQKARFMLHLNQQIFDGPLALDKFLEYANEGNREFVYDDNQNGWPF